MAAALRATSRVSSVIPLAVGVLVLAGWALAIETFKRLVPGLTAMNPATAVGFLCLGGSLALLARSARGRVPPILLEKTDGGAQNSLHRRQHLARKRMMRRAASALAMVAVLFGLSRIVALMGLWDPGVDQLLFRDKLAFADFGRPNRMAPNTALNLPSASRFEKSGSTEIRLVSDQRGRQWRVETRCGTPRATGTVQTLRVRRRTCRRRR